LTQKKVLVEGYLIEEIKDMSLMEIATASDHVAI